MLLFDFQGVSSQRGSLIPQSGGSRQRKVLTVAPLGARLMLVALLVPGAWSFLSEEQEELLVELHNHYRGQVSPNASAMLPLKWDPNLKVIAEGYAAKCIWNHNPELEDTGENLFAGTGPLDLREALEKWFLEHLDYDFHNNSCDEDKMCGHYTQMVWADTHRVGCAFHLCNSMEGLEWERVSYLVCNYYPAGNYEGERPYVEGDRCSRCPENLQKCENNLCVADTEAEDEEVDDMTVLPPLLTTEWEEKEVAPPPATTSSFLELGTIITSPPEDTEVPTTPPLPSPTLPPQVPSAREDTKQEEGKKKVEMEGREATDKQQQDWGRKVGGNPKRDMKHRSSAGSVSTAPLLLVCLTAILTLTL